ncbi:MAG: hypothetical protein AAB606_03960 [Patescibacteria group bacterium]
MSSTPPIAPTEAGQEQLKLTPELLQTLAAAIASLDEKSDLLTEEMLAKDAQVQTLRTTGAALKTQEGADLSQLLEAVENLAFTEGAYDKVLALARTFCAGNEKWSGAKAAAVIREVNEEKVLMERQLIEIRTALTSNAQALRDLNDPAMIAGMVEIPDQADLSRKQADLNRQFQHAQLIVNLLETFLQRLDPLEGVSNQESGALGQDMRDINEVKRERGESKDNAKNELHVTRESIATNAAETEQAERDLRQLHNTLAAARELKAELQTSGMLIEGVLNAREFVQLRTAEVAEADALLGSTASRIRSMAGETMARVHSICAEVLVGLGQERGANAARAAVNDTVNTIVSDDALLGLLTALRNIERLTQDPTTFRIAAQALTGVNERLKHLLSSTDGALKGGSTAVPTTGSLEPLVTRMFDAQPAAGLKEVIAEQSGRIASLEEDLTTNAQVLAESALALQAAQQRVTELEAQIAANPADKELARVQGELAQAQGELVEVIHALEVSERSRQEAEEAEEASRDSASALGVSQSALADALESGNIKDDEIARLRAEVDTTSEQVSNLSIRLVAERNKLVESERMVGALGTEYRELSTCSAAILAQLRRMGNTGVNSSSGPKDVLEKAANVLTALAEAKERKAAEKKKKGV